MEPIETTVASFALATSGDAYCKNDPPDASPKIQPPSQLTQKKEVTTA